MELEDWDDEDEMGVAAAFVMAFAIGVVSVSVISAAIAWNVASHTAAAFQKVKGWF